MSEIDLCNRALGEMGSRSNITSFDEDSSEAYNCKLFYNPIRQSALRGGPWGFARRQGSLSLLSTSQTDSNIYPWTYKYLYPAECIKLRYLLPAPPTGADGVELVPGFSMIPIMGPSRNNRFLVGVEGVGSAARRVVYSNVKNAIGVWVSDETNTDLFDPLFQDVIVKALAAKLVFPLAGEVKLREGLYNEASQILINAQVADGNEAMPQVNHEPDWLAARNGYTYAGVAQIGGWNNLGIWYDGWDNPGWGS